jgi:DNA-directed RNA polymerase subunit RPC12/RpoP
MPDPSSPLPAPQPLPKAPTVIKEPPASRKFPCVKCGARLDFDPRARSLQCPYCGHVEKIEQGQAGVQERDLEEYLSRQAGETIVQGRKLEVKCQTCAAVVLLEDRVATSRCPYCGTFLENKPQEARAMVQPEGVLPFAIDTRKAAEAFRAWVNGLWFAPGELKKWADRGQLNGCYLPFWTYDSMTYTHYVGARGDDYQETETYMETETYVEDGETKTRQVPRTRTVTRTIWTPVSGEVQHFFDDVLICASQSLPEHYVSLVTPSELAGLEEFKPEFLSGFVTERYTVAPKEGWEKAKLIMDGQIRQLCRQDIGGNHQRLDSVETQHVGVTFKHILLPVWLTSYRYREKTYRVLINGRTGQVTGDRPYSVWKILALVLVILAIVAALVFVFTRITGSARAASVPGQDQARAEATLQRQAVGPGHRVHSDLEGRQAAQPGRSGQRLDRRAIQAVGDAESAQPAQVRRRGQGPQASAGQPGAAQVQFAQVGRVG